MPPLWYAAPPPTCVQAPSATQSYFAFVIVCLSGYTPAMNPEVLASELERDPFIPLRVHLSDGRVLDINNPGLCYIARLALYVFRAGREHATLAEDVQIVSLRHIVSVETMEPSRPA